METSEEERMIISDLLKIATKNVKYERNSVNEYKEKILALNTLYDMEMMKVDFNKYFLRKKRRDYYTKEGIIIPPGEWDEDLDIYQEKEYLIHIGNGYLGKARRNIMLSWNGYIIVPEGHWSIGKDLTNYDLPFEISFHQGREIGFDHCRLLDKTPLDVFFGRCIDEIDGKKYTAFPDIMKEVIHLGKYLQGYKI
jgi:hypothetical protein